MTDDTGNLAAERPYVTAFEAAVTGVDGRDVTLDQTYFYPEGGGQPADHGTLGGVEVADVQKRDDATVHTLAADPSFEAGDTVEGELDEAFRTYSMRAHTASHVVYGVGRRLIDGHGYGGFDIGEDTVRLDFDVEGDADDVDALDFQRRANEAVWDDRAVGWYEMDADEARANDDIVFNLRDDADAAETVRIVEIDGWDVSACGGTHVGTTSEIGPVSVLGVSNPGADLLRVEFAVGPTAIRRGVETRRNAARAAETLDTSVGDLPERAEGLLSENEALRDERDELRERVLDARIASLSADSVARDGEEWVVGTVESVGPNAVSDRLRARDLPADVVALVGRDGATFIVVGTGGETDANEVIDEVTEEFGGGGGGQPTLAQGGGLDAEPRTVVDFLRSDAE
ncbi:alanyl-tRNA editing protein [Haloarcula nitratireducens]|uniref:Alanyl-transfer RNA synthetases family profile domain-containing protein n=1 Tax=Haloarcula nitratireducens TaxID=2487749 RepID=A0AAW4PII0_9EURY|nr:alanyl-tRNA editing protein [Halomicroarcula nitratireducens]MBX0297728.1 hypothetical protein [Halomicroarcula nitratireducens]